ncbi:MAG TPA: crosslink repair DNA glycosylase YcaQ family protein, partial [Nocardioidaceae bacterium]|nr:crosslink repair DNA glycosylase YcaQ family protein [Nocardioidaceae bacterium]
MDDRDIARWRVRTQRLVTPHAASAGDVVAGLLAVQAENASQAAWAVASRTKQPDQADLAALLDSGQVLRTHVLRPTWHFVSADDIVWLLEVTAPRNQPIMLKQLQAGGLDDAAIERATDDVLDVLSHSHLTRAGLAEALKDRGHELTGFLLMILLARIEFSTLICSG